MNFFPVQHCIKRKLEVLDWMNISRKWNLYRDFCIYFHWADTQFQSEFSYALLLLEFLFFEKKNRTFPLNSMYLKSRSWNTRKPFGFKLLNKFQTIRKYNTLFMLNYLQLLWVSMRIQIEYVCWKIVSYLVSLSSKKGNHIVSKVYEFSSMLMRIKSIYEISICDIGET